MEIREEDRFRFELKPETTKEYHIPYHNYAGPGTRVLQRVFDKKQPINSLDAASLIHDIEYYIMDQQTADDNYFWNLISQSKANLPLAVLSRLSFYLKDLIGYKQEKDINKYTIAKQLVQENQLLKNYKMKFNQQRKTLH